MDYTIKTDVVDRYVESPIKIYTEGYDIGQDLLGVQLVPDYDAGPEFVYHSIFKVSEPHPTPGIVSHPDFKCLRNISLKEFGEVQDRVIELITLASQEDKSISTSDIMFLNLFSPVFFPQTGATDLSLIIGQICKLNDGDFGSSMLEPFPETGSDQAPLAYLPIEFEPEVDKLTINDLLHIWPETEQKLLALCIGRVLCGPDGITHLHSGYEVSHAFRTFCLMYGFDAGTGKSTFFEYLIDAIESVGYKVAAFNKLDDHFGMGDICTKDMAYADDLNTDSLSSLLKAPLFKQMITGAKIRAHIKHAADVEVRSKSVFFACVNDFSPNALYGLDNGTLNRLAILCTRTRVEIKDLKPTGLSKGSPDLRTREHVKWLCDKLNVPAKTLFLKFAKLCAQMFMSELKNGTLEGTINELKRGLRTQIHEALDYSSIQLMQFCYMLRTGSNFVPQLNGAILSDAFKHLNFIINDDRAYHTRELIKSDWKEQGRPSQHIWVAAKLLDNISIHNCDKLTDTLENTSIIKDSAKAIKAYWADLRLASGFNLAGNVAMIKQNWSVATKAPLTDLLTTCRIHSDSAILDEKLSAQTSHLFKKDYDRETYIRNLSNSISSGDKLQKLK